MKRAAIVLCGGLSSRMGRAKAWLPWFGRTMVEHVVGRVRPAVDEVVVVTSQTLDLPALDARIVRDRDAERGPLAGLRDGLLAADADRCFVTGTDAPFLASADVEALLERGEACAPVSDGFVQVLCAVYPKRAGAEAQRLLDAGQRRPLDLLEALGYEAVEAAALRRGDDPPPWLGFNAPRDYLAAVQRVDPDATCEVEMLGRAALHAEPPRRRLPVGTLGELLRAWPSRLALLEEGEAQARVSKRHLVSLGGRELVRDLGVPVGPDERVSVIDALAGG